MIRGHFSGMTEGAQRFIKIEQIERSDTGMEGVRGSGGERSEGIGSSA